MGILDDVTLRIDELAEKVAYLTGQVDLLVRMHLGLEETAHVQSFSKTVPPEPVVCEQTCYDENGKVLDELDEAVEQISGTLDDLAQGTVVDGPADGTN